MLSLVLVLSLTAAAAAQGEQCGEEEMQGSVRDYLNHLNMVIQINTEKIRTRKQAHLRELHANITRGFNEAGCPNVWAKIFPQPTEDTEYDIWLWELFQKHGVLGHKPPPEGIEMARTVETFIWLIGRDHEFASCVMTRLRDHILDWIANSCTKGGFGYSSEGLDMFFVPRYVEDLEFEKNLRSFTSMYAYAYLAARSCGSLRDAQRVVQKINEWVVEDFCYAAVDTFMKDSCLDNYEKVCPVVVGCFRDLTEHFKAYKRIIFGEKRDILMKINDCVDYSKQQWAGERPLSVPTLGSLLKEGIKLAAKLQSNDIPKERKKDVKVFLKAIVKSHFRLESCDCVKEGGDQA